MLTTRTSSSYFSPFIEIAPSACASSSFMVLNCRSIRFLIILAENELKNGNVIVKDLKENTQTLLRVEYSV